jgi:hypothetical protein
MAIDHLGKDLEALGLSGRDLRCLLYLPQVYVGWASPHRDVPYLEALLDTTARRARYHPECLSVARGWLFERPSQAQFQSGFALLRVLRRAGADPLISSSDILQAMSWAVRAAKQARLAHRASAEGELERSAAWRALTELEGWLEVDTRHLWLDILSDVRHLRAAPSAASPPAPNIERKRPSSSATEPPIAGANATAGAEHSNMRLLRQPGGLGAAPFPLARRIG